MDAKPRRKCTCERCGGVFAAGLRGPLKKWCPICAPNGRGPADNRHRHAPAFCKDCGAGLSRPREGWARKTCGNCKRNKAAERGRRASRKKVSASHYRRCKRRGLPFDFGLLSHLIHERDQYRCMLCGCETVCRDPMLCPTVGHIVPLNNPLNTRHGHTADNTFTACWRCNHAQGNAVVIDGHQRHDDPRATYMEYVANNGFPFRQNRGWGRLQHQRPTEDPTRPLQAFVGSSQKIVRCQNG
jgi:hypothetical protein